MNLRNLKVFTSHESYMSISRTARDHHDIVRRVCQGVDDPYEADVAIINQTPVLLHHLLSHVPALQRCYLIGYLVWEASEVPEAMLAGIRMVDEIWTPSAYCHAIFSRVHPRVTWVPHVIERDCRFDTEDVAFWDDLLPTHANAFNFLTVSRNTDLRKNLRTLAQAFQVVAPRMPDARLIIKDHGGGTYRPGVYVQGPIVRCVGNCTARQLNALYDRSHVYVSAHCSEGWGLPMSDAMLMGKPVVATGYSGNLDFMTPHNSLLVAATEEVIHQEDAYYRFAPPMRWGYVHREALEAQLLSAYTLAKSDALTDRVTQARHDVKLFDRHHLTWHIKQRLKEISAGLRDRSLTRPGLRC